MDKVDEFIVRGNEFSILTKDNEVINLSSAVERTAMDLFSKYRDYRNSTNEEKDGLKAEIRFQSTILNSLSNALSSLNSAKE